jgi:preprotein translocase subunit SecF
MELIPHDLNLDFVGKRHFFLALSTGINVAAVILMLTWGLNYGLDFTGGTLVEVRFLQPLTGGVIRQTVQGQGLEDLTIQDIGRDGRTFLFRFRQPEDSVGETGQAVQTALGASFGGSANAWLRKGANLRKRRPSSAVRRAERSWQESSFET